MTPETRRTLIRAGTGIALIFVLIWLMNTLSSVTTLVMTTLALSYILNPVVSRLSSWGLSRSTASALIIFTGLFTVVTFIIFFVPAVIKEITAFVRIWPGYLKTLEALIFRAAETFDIQIPSDWQSVTTLLLDKWQQVLPRVADPVAKVLSIVFSSTLQIISTLFYLFMLPVFTYYLMVSFESIKQTVVDLIPWYAREPVLEKLTRIDMMMAGFVRGQLTICILLSILYSIGFVIIGIDLPVFLGTLSGMLFIIPYVGTAIGLITGSIMALAKFGDLIHVAEVILWIGVVQLFESYFLTPRIVGEAIGLHPVIYILALIIGGNLFGFVGMLVAIPATAIIKVLLSSLIEMYKKTFLYQEPVE